MVLHRFDFVEGSNRLNLHGKDELARIACSLPRNPYPLIIERTPDAPGLAEARRLAVLNELERGSFPVPPERIVIGPSLANDLRGGEAQIIHRSLLGQIQTSGLPILPGILQPGGSSNVGGGAGGSGNVAPGQPGPP
jgi:hypothetical protein